MVRGATHLKRHGDGRARIALGVVSRLVRSRHHCRAFSILVLLVGRLCRHQVLALGENQPKGVGEGGLPHVEDVVEAIEDANIDLGVVAGHRPRHPQPAHDHSLDRGLGGGDAHFKGRSRDVRIGDEHVN